MRLTIISSASKDDDIKKTVNNNIHDIADSQVLAIRTDAQFHDEVKEVKLCRCWHRNRKQFVRSWRHPRQVWCELCERLSIDQSGFWCTEELEAHVLA